jgi:hypothetical protein
LRRILGEDHPYTLYSASNLAHDLYALGDYPQARVLYEDTLTRRRRTLGEDHPDTLMSATDLANALHALGDSQKARRVEEWIKQHSGGNRVVTPQGSSTAMLRRRRLAPRDR